MVYVRAGSRPNSLHMALNMGQLVSAIGLGVSRGSPVIMRNTPRCERICSRLIIFFISKSEPTKSDPFEALKVGHKFPCEAKVWRWKGVLYPSFISLPITCQSSSRVVAPLTISTAFAIRAATRTNCSSRLSGIPD